MPKGMQMDPAGQVLMKRLSGFCSDCTVLHGASYVSNADGSRVDIKVSTAVQTLE
jgi:hypothetical protein